MKAHVTRASAAVGPRNRGTRWAVRSFVCSRIHVPFGTTTTPHGTCQPPVQLNCPACRDFHAPRASFAPAHGRPLRVCGSAGLSYTHIHGQLRPPRHPAEARHSANGGWACVSECVLLRYDVIASSPSAGLCAGVLVVTGGARMCAEHTDAIFGLRARASPLPHGAQPPLQRT